jgi:nucleoside-diphosphate-sugar epimerase
MSDLWAVTGASGFIGRSLLQSLDADSIAVRTLSRRALPRSDHVVGDIRDRAALEALVAGASVVVHLGSFVHRSVRSEEHLRECNDVNVGGTKLLVDVLAAQPRPPFLVYLSSASVYAVSDQPSTELAPLAPTTPYGSSKLEAERSVLSGVVPATVLRPAMVFGHGAKTNLERVQRMIRGRVVIEVGDGNQKKTLVPVENVVAAIRGVAERRTAAAGEIFNVGGASMSMHEIVAEMAEALQIRPLTVPMPLFAARAMAKLADATIGRVYYAAPSFRQLVQSYVTTAVLDDSKLHALIGDSPTVGDIRAALRRFAVLCT